MAPKTARVKSPQPGGDDKKPDKGSKTKRAGSPAKGNKTKRSGTPSKKKGGDKDGSGAAAAAAPADAAADDEGASKTVNKSLFKAITTGPTAAIEFMDEEEVEHAHEPPKPDSPEVAAPAAEPEAAPSEDAGAPKMSWSCYKWLTEIPLLLQCVSEALCTSAEAEKLEDEAALGWVRELDSRDALLERLKSGCATEKLADAIWPKLEVLKAGPATAAELANQWQSEGAGSLSYGGLPAFFNGLEPRIGSPDPNVFKDMAADHCGRPDAQVEFTTGNYSVVTTSEVEWKFVVEPEAPLKWPIEERLMHNEASKGHMRKLMSVEMLQRRMDEQNKKLEAVGGDLLQYFEVVGGRLYTGPLFVKYNGVLRGLDSPVHFLKNDLVTLVTPKEMSERYMGTAKKWEPANGTLPYDKVRKELNLYTTTIHVINSCIVKMGKLTVAKPVYRGMSGRLFPDTFWKANEQGIKGGVEFAFMSTTPDRSVAEQYSQDGFGIIVEIQQGMIDRGAEISWLSQYPHEAEILFAPLAGLEAREMRIDKHPLNGQHIIVVVMRISINLTNPTIEAVVAKRRKICSDMGRGLLMEVRSALNKKGSAETDAYIRMLSGLFDERPLSHEATWYNDDPCFQEAVNETLRLKREVANVPTLETKKLEGDAVAQLLGETLTTKPKVLVIPETMFKEFNKLRVLNLDGFGGITSLPTSIGGLSALHTLHLRECEALEQLPRSMGRLKSLSTLNLTSCKELKELPSELGSLVSLTALDLGFCRSLTSLPAEIGKLINLQNLKLQQCSGLTEVPASIGKLRNLKLLTLYGCSALTQLPDAIGQLPELQELNLRACSGLTSLPPTLGSQLPSLTTLDLTLCKGLTSLPDTIGKLQNLETLFLGNCFNIPQLPPTITKLKSLVTMNLYNCGGLKYLPNTFDELESLQVLSLQGCEKLIEVPESLARCLTLNTLTLWNCQVLERIPDLTPIPKLQIDGVPEQLADWESEQKKKRAEDAKEGKNKGQVAGPAKTSGWAAIKKGHSLQGTAASQHGRAMTREELEARNNPKVHAEAQAAAGKSGSPPKTEGEVAPSGGEV